MTSTVEKVIYLKKYVERNDIDTKKLMKVFDKLDRVPVTLEILQETGIGKAVNQLRKREDVGQRARELVAKWKQTVDVQSSPSKLSSQKNKPKNDENGSSSGQDNKKEHSSSSKKRPHSPRKTDKHKRQKVDKEKVNSTEQNNIDEEANNGLSFGDSLISVTDVKLSKITQSKQSNKDVKKKDTKSDKRGRHDDEDDDSDISKTGIHGHRQHKKHRSHKHKKEKKDDSESENSQLNRQPHLVVPTPSREIKLSEMDIASLPDISPNYKPMPRYPDMDSATKNVKVLDDFNSDLIGTKQHSRTAVYAGRKTYATYTSVPSLYDVCISMLKDNIDAIDYVGGIPGDILKPVLEKCTPSQLYNLEDLNPHLIEDTDDIWKMHTLRDFKRSQPDESEMETWRELYLKNHDEREKRLKKITANISLGMAKQLPVRAAKLAYVNSAVKPPRDIQRKQARFGTAGPSAAIEPLKKLTSKGGTGVFKNPVPVDRNQSHYAVAAAAASSRQKAVKQIAPMMKKTLKFMKGMRR